jgi:hypothetical protein
MRIEDDDENLLGYDFPVTIYKLGGAEYRVDNLESLEYHILQGWSVEKPEEPEEVAPVVLLTPDSLDDLRAEVAALRKEVAELRAAAPNPEMIKGQGQLLASVSGRVSALEKAGKPGRPPVVPPAPEAPPAV